MPTYDQDYAQIINNATTSGSFTGTEVWIIISCILAIFGGIALYVLFLNPNNEKNIKDNYVKLHQFFNFKITIIQPILKILYLISTIAITLSSFAYIGTNFFTFLFMLIFGNVALRITFEVLLLLITLTNNVSDINKKMSAKEEKTKKKTLKNEKDEAK